MERFLRTEILLGKDKLARLKKSSVMVIGLGAVGSFATEALARVGIGHLDLIDFDTVSRSNINRQLYALESTVGMSKAVVAQERVRQVNPRCAVIARQIFVTEKTIEEVFSQRPDMVIDAIDSVSSKVHVLVSAKEKNIPIISSMGAALRTDPSRIKIGDLFMTRGCPLARFIRKRLRNRGIREGIPCVYSDEKQNQGRYVPPCAHDFHDEGKGRQRNILGSLPTVTGMFGLMLAHYVIEFLCGGFDANE